VTREQVGSIKSSNILCNVKILLLTLFFLSLAAGTLMAGTPEKALDKLSDNRFKQRLKPLGAGKMTLGGSHYSPRGEGTVTAGTPAKVNLNVQYTYEEDDMEAHKNAFQKASEKLFNSTDGQMQFDKIYVYDKDAPRDKMDVLIQDNNDGASANPGGMGKAGWHIWISQTHKSTSGAALGQFGIVHEWGHYGFKLYDEYFKSDGTDAYCISTTSEVTCIMDGGTKVTPRNKRTEFCHKNNHIADNKQHSKHGESCWEHLVPYCKSTYNITLTETTGTSTEMPGGHSNIDWIIMGTNLSQVICIDRSGSMDGSPISLAKQAGKLFVDLVEKEKKEFIAVTSFASGASTDYSLTEVTNDGVKSSAKSAIGGLSSSGDTAIGMGLSNSLAELQTLPEGESAKECIILLSDGDHNSGPDPSTVVPSLVTRKAAVYTVGLGNDVNVGLLQGIAADTGGKYYHASSAGQLQRIFTDISAELENEETAEETEGELTPGGNEQTDITVDSFSTQMTFMLRWDDGDFDLKLLKPDLSTEINSSNYNSYNEVEYVKSTEGKYAFFRVGGTTLAQGKWRMIVEADGTNTADVSYSTQVLANANDVEFTVLSSQDEYTYPETPVITASVIAGYRVVGANVSGIVTRPNGSTKEITLFDDGNSDDHGDDLLNDGVYSNRFGDFQPSGNGVYSFKITVQNENGISAAPDEQVASYTPRSIAPFTRKSAAYLQIAGLPENVPPTRPVNTAPGNGSLQVPLIPILGASDFSDENATDTHKSSEWRISDTASDYSSPAWTQSSTTSLTSISVPVDSLMHSKTYYWQVRYQDSSDNWSLWSEESSFTTQIGEISSVTGGGGCFIATAAFGSPQEPHVGVLRQFRDRYLQTNGIGRMLVRIYYRFSPKYASIISGNERLKTIVRFVLMPLILFAVLSLKFGPAIWLFALAMFAGFVLLLLRFRGHRRQAKAAVLVSFMAAGLLVSISPTSAMDFNHCKVAVGEQDLVFTPSTRTLSPQKFQLDYVFIYADKPAEAIVGGVQRQLSKYQLISSLSLTYGASRHFQLSLTFPYLFYQDSAIPEYAFPIDSSGFGNIIISAKYRFRGGTDRYGIAVAPFISLDTGDVTTLISAKSARGGMKFIFDRNWADRTVLALNLGWSHQAKEKLGQITVGDSFLFGVGVSHRCAESSVYFTTEICGRNEGGFFSEDEKTPVEVLFSMGVRKGGARLILGCGKGITTGYGTSNFRLFSGLRAEF